MKIKLPEPLEVIAKSNLVILPKMPKSLRITALDRIGNRLVYGISPEESDRLLNWEISKKERKHKVTKEISPKEMRWLFSFYKFSDGNLIYLFKHRDYVPKHGVYETVKSADFRRVVERTECN